MSVASLAETVEATAPIHINLTAQLASRGAVSVRMRPQQLIILRALMVRPAFADHEYLIARIWAADDVPATPRQQINVQIGRLRKLIVPLRIRIKTVWWRGYLVEIDP